MAGSSTSTGSYDSSLALASRASFLGAISSRNWFGKLNESGRENRMESGREGEEESLPTYMCLQPLTDYATGFGLH